MGMPRLSSDREQAGVALGGNHLLDIRLVDPDVARTQAIAGAAGDYGCRQIELDGAGGEHGRLCRTPGCGLEGRGLAAGGGLGTGHLGFVAAGHSFESIGSRTALHIGETICSAPIAEV